MNGCLSHALLSFSHQVDSLREGQLHKEENHHMGYGL